MYCIDAGISFFFCFRFEIDTNKQDKKKQITINYFENTLVFNIINTIFYGVLNTIIEKKKSVTISDLLETKITIDKLSKQEYK